MRSPAADLWKPPVNGWLLKRLQQSRHALLLHLCLSSLLLLLQLLLHLLPAFMQQQRLQLCSVRQLLGLLLPSLLR